MKNTELELIQWQLDRVVELLPDEGAGTIVNVTTLGIRSPTVRSLVVTMLREAFDNSYTVDISSKRESPDDWDGYLVIEHPQQGDILIETAHAKKVDLSNNHGSMSSRLTQTQTQHTYYGTQNNSSSRRNITS